MLHIRLSQLWRALNLNLVHRLMGGHVPNLLWRFMVSISKNGWRRSQPHISASNLRSLIRGSPWTVYISKSTKKSTNRAHRRRNLSWHSDPTKSQGRNSNIIQDWGAKIPVPGTRSPYPQPLAVSRAQMLSAFLLPSERTLAEVWSWTGTRRGGGFLTNSFSLTPTDAFADKTLILFRVYKICPPRWTKRKAMSRCPLLHETWWPRSSAMTIALTCICKGWHGITNLSNWRTWTKLRSDYGGVNRTGLHSAACVNVMLHACLGASLFSCIRSRSEHYFFIPSLLSLFSIRNCKNFRCLRFNKSHLTSPLRRWICLSCWYEVCIWDFPSCT
jgi:hypothetical protein